MQATDAPADPIRIAQLSDTHFLADGDTPEGGFAYNTSEAFAAVRDHLEARGPFDLVAVTGDVADHGLAPQYRQATAALGTISSPVNSCPGNHDQNAAFTIGMGRPGISTSRVVEINNWCFLFVDSNSGVMVPEASGRLIDPVDYGDRLHRNGALGERESAWVREMCAATTADHVFIWLHHPPGVPIGMDGDDAYTGEWEQLIADLPTVRGMGGGHTHVPYEYEFDGRPVFVCPALKNNFDLKNKTMLPPGYRTYDFASSGEITSQTHLVDDPRWPRAPLGRAVMSLMTGELSWDEFNAIVARKKASA